MTTRKQARGFTLVETMVVVIIIIIIATLAIKSIGRTNRYGAVDGFAAKVRNGLAVARRRAVSERANYLVVITSKSITWCQIRDAEVVLDNTVETSCPGSNAKWESEPTSFAAPGAVLSYWAKTVDNGQGGVVQLAPAAKVYFKPDGTADSDASTTQLEGLTLYIQGDADTGVKRKILLTPFGGRSRITDSW